MPGMKQFVTWAFMITATKGKKDVLSDKHRKWGGTELSKGLCSLEVLPKLADFSEEGEEVGFKNKMHPHFQTVSY